MKHQLFLAFNILLTLLIGKMELCAEKKWAPDFIVAGAMKSGTTALRRFLIQHPKIALSYRNEVHFFDVRFDRGPQWYKEQFPRRPSPSHLIGEKSPYYLVHPRVPRRIHALYPNVKLIMILRNPIDRAYSHYHFNVRRNLEALTFEQAIVKEPSRIKKGEKELKRGPAYDNQDFRLYSYLKRGMYAEQINRWFSYFPREQILIITHEELNERPIEVMNELFAFLDLEPYDQLEIDHELSNYPSMQESTREELSEFFRLHNQKLYELLGRNLGWD